MAHCLNHKHPEIQELAQKTGLHPALVAAKAALWQEKNNNLDRFPTAKEIINSDQVTIIKDAIKSSLPIEVSNAVTVVRNVPKDVLGRDDLFLSMKNVLEEKGITNTFLINWLGINLPSNMSRKQAINSINSESQIEGLAKKSYDNLLKADHPALQNKEIRQSFNSWVKALENYPVVFKDLMLKHAIKNLNPDRRAKFVLQLSAVALQQTYGIAVNKPHELNRIGKLYDSEVLKTVSDAVGHEPSASGKGYWVHIPRTKNNTFTSRITDISNDKNAPGKFQVEYLKKGVEDTADIDFFETREEAENFIKTLEPTNNSAQFKVNVELLRKLSPSTWCTASGMASHYVENYDNYLLIVDGVTVAGIEAYPANENRIKELKNDIDRINSRIEDMRRLTPVGYTTSISSYKEEKLKKEDELERAKKIQVKEVTSRANNGVSSIDHFDDIYAFFEKHNLDTNNYSLQAAKKAKEAGQKDSEISENPGWEDFEEQVEDDYAPAWDEGDDRDDPGLEYRREEERWNNLHTVQAMETEAEVLQAIEANTVPVFDYFNALPQHLKDTEAIARLAIANNSHNITHISHTVPFYIELARLSITRNPNVFHYLSTEAQAMPEFQKIHQDHIDSLDFEISKFLIEDLPFSKTNNNQIQGYYDPNTDKVVVVASNTPVDEAAKVAIHEVAHRGMIRMAQDLGGTNELNKILFNAEKELMKKLPELLERTGHKNVESLVKDYGFDINTKEGKAKLLSELAARWAETLIDKPKPSWWKEFLTSIQNWIKKFTGKTLSEEEVNELVGGFVRYGAKVNKPSTKQKSQNTSKVKAEPVYFSLTADVKKAIDPKLEAAVDKVIDNLVQRIEELKTIAGGSTNQSTRINIARLQTKLAELSEERTYEKLADIALYQLNEASRILALDTPSAFELNEVKRILIYTENFDSYLTEGGKDFKAVKDLIREKNVTSNVIFQEKLLDAAFAQSKITGVEYSREELNKAQKDESKLAAQTLSPEYSSVNLAKIIGRAIVLANRKTQEDFSNNFIDPLAELLRALDKKKFETSDFNEVMEDGKLILEFTNEFFEHESNMWRKHYELLQDYKKDTKLGAQIKASFEDIFTWYKDNLDYYVTPETRKKYEQDLADFKKANLDANGKETAKTAEAVRKWQAVNSPYLMLKRTEDEDGNQTIESDPDGKVFIDAKIVWTTQIGDKYYKNTNWHKYLKARPKKKYKNSKWEKASENPLHKFMLEKYVEAMKMLPRKVAVDTENYHRFLNEFSLDVTQSENRLKQMYSGIGNIARETFTIQVNQAMLDGGVIKKIVNPDGSITEEFQPFLRSKDEKGNTKPHIKHKTIEDLKKREKFRDPLEILQEFFKQAVTYNHRVEAAPMLDLLQYKIENLPGISTNMINAILLDAHRNPEIIENGLVNTAAQTRYAINAFKSGITRMDSDLGAIITDKQKAKLRELTEAWVAGGMQGPAPTISPISGVKVSDALVDYTRMSLIGLKPFTAATNLLLGLMSNYVYAARNKEFSEKHLDQASRLLFGNILKFISRKRVVTSDAKKIANLSEKMGITDTLYETKDPDVAIQAKNKFVKFVYALQEGGEFLIANQSMLAMMLNTKITSKEGNEVSLWDAYNEDGNLKPEFQTKEWTSVEIIDDKGDNISKLNAFRNSLDKIRKRTQGDYQSPMAAKGEWYFRHLMMFRTWIPHALRERWGKEDEDFKGRYRSYGAMFTHSFKSAGFKGFLETAGRFALATIAKMTNILPLGKYRFDKLDNAAKESFDKYLDKIGASELDIENMRANIKELQFLLTITIVALGLQGLKGDDDDDKTLNFLINIMHRLNADLTAFVHPKSALSIIKDPLPVMKTIKDVVDVLQAGSDYIENPEGRYYKKGYNKGDLKFFEEVQDLLPIYSAINSTQGTLNTVFNSESYKYAK